MKLNKLITIYAITFVGVISLLLTSYSYAEEQKEPYTTADLMEQSGKELKQADKRLNDIYKKLMTAIKNPLVKKDLRNQQRQWIKDRDKYCAPPETDHALGSIWQMSEISCLLYLTNYRADQLEEILSDYE